MFPLRERLKEPVAGSRGFKDATRRLAKINSWWEENPEYNIGIATGKKSNIVVVDLDGPEATAWFKQQGYPRTRTVLTGKGVHVYYGWPEGEWNIRNSASKLAPFVDVRGDGGYVAAPPSIHPNGNVYRWFSVDVPIVPMPQDLAALCHKEPSEGIPAGFVPRVCDTTSPYGRAVLTASCQEVSSATHGVRNDTLNTRAFVVGQFVAGGEIDAGEARDALVLAALASGLSGGSREAHSVISRAFRAAMSQPKVATPT